MRIIYKLIIGFLSISILVGLVGYISISTNRHIKYATSQLNQSSLVELYCATEMALAVENCQSSVGELLLDYMINQVDEDPVALKEGIEKKRQVIQTNLANFEANVKNSKQATEFGLKSAQEGLDEQTAERESAEIEVWYVRIDESFNHYRNMIDQFLGILNIDPAAKGENEKKARDKANKFFEEQIEVYYYEKLQPLAVGYKTNSQVEMIKGLEEIDAKISTANIITGFSTMISFIIAIIIGVFIAGSISRPIAKLRDAAIAVGRGDFDYPIKVHTGGEIKQLARSFRKMSKELQRAQQHLEERIKERTAELRQVNMQLRVENFERKHIERALRRSEARSKAIVDALPDLMFRISDDGVFLDYRAPEKSDLFSPDDQIIGSNIENILPPELAKKTMQLVQEALRSRNIHFMEYGLPVEGKIQDYEARLVACGKNEVLIIVRNISDRKEWERALKASEAKLSNALTIARLGHWEYDVINDLFIFNDHLYAILHTTAEQEGGYTMSSGEYAKRFVHPDDLPIVGAEIQKALETKDPNYSRKLQHRIYYADGKPGYIAVHVFVAKDENGRTIRTYGVNQDITERKMAEMALKQSEQDFKGLFEGAHDAIIIFQPKNEIVLDVNRRACEMYGFGRTEFIGMSMEGISKNVDKGKKQIRKTVKTGFFHSFETVHYKKDGSEMYVDINASLVNFRGQQAIQSINRDITEWKKAEEGLKLFRTLIDRSNDIIEVLDPATGRFLDVNEKACTDLGYTRDELLSMTIFDIDPTVNINLYKQATNEIRKGGMMWEGVHKRKDGSTYPVELNINEVQLDRNYRVTVARDITDRLKAEEALRDREQKLTTIIEHSNELFFIYDTQFRVTYVSPQSKQIFGYAPEEMLIEWTEFLTDNPINKEGFKLAEKTVTTGKTQKPFLLEVKKKDGKHRIVEIDQSPVLDEDGKVIGVSGALRDITEKKQAEEALKMSERKFRQLYENIPDAIFLTRMSGLNRGEILDVNRSAELQTGYEKDELIGMNIIKDLKSELANKKEIAKYEFGVSSKDSVRFMEKKRRKDGSEYWTEVQITKLDYGDESVLLSVNRDVTDRKQAEKQIRWLARFPEENPAPVVRVSKAGEILYANKSSLPLLKKWRSEINKTLPKSWRNLIVEVFSSGKNRNVEVPCENQIFSLTLSPVREETYVNIYGTDITDRKLAEGALQESEERYRLLFESNPQPMWVYDLETLGFLAVNDAANHKYGYSQDEFLSMTIKDIRPNGDVPALLSNIDQGHDGIESGEWQHQKKDGTVIAVEVTSHEHKWAARRSRVVLAHDVTERKRAQEALAESEERYRTLAESAPVSIYIVNKKMEVDYVNKYGAALVNKRPSQIINKHLTQVFPQHIAERQISTMKSIFESGGHYRDIVKIAFPGIFMWTDTQLMPLRSPAGNIYAVLGISHDITELKTTGDALKQYTARLEALQEIYRGILASKSSEEIADATLSQLRKIVSKFQRSTVVLFDLNSNEATILAHNVRWESKVTKREHLPLSHFRHIYDLANKPYVLVRDLKKHKSKAPVEAQLLKEGVRSYFSLPLKINDRLFGSFNIGSDTPDAFSEQEIEIACEVGEQLAVAINQVRLKEQIQQHTAKIQASLHEKEMLLKEIHHRVKNNMQVISSLLNLQSVKIQDKSSMELFRESENRIKSMALIHEKLYQSESLSRINFADYIAELTNGLFSSYSHNSREVRLTLDVDEIYLGVDTAIPCGLIINELVSNAFKYAFPENRAGEIAVKLHAAEKVKGREGDNGAASECQYILIVRDNGVGIRNKPDLRSTKSLGLKLVHSLVQQLKGKIDYYNNDGAEFNIQFQEIDKTSIKRREKVSRLDKMGAV